MLAGTLCLAAEKLRDAGASGIMAIVTHGVFSGKAIERLNSSCLDWIACTNSIPQVCIKKIYVFVCV